MMTRWVVMCLMLASAAVPATNAHGVCAHEVVHTYVLGLSVFAYVDDGKMQAGAPTLGTPSARPAEAKVLLESSPRGLIDLEVGAVVVTDSETGDCDGDGIAFDWDGDLDIGVGGGAFGHGPWAEHCGFHQEAAGSVTVNDLAFGKTVVFVTGSGDTNSWVADPVTGENTCLTDGFISPSTDPEGDDCLSTADKGTHAVVCPGGGDG
ncbi:MAG TPA: hypothetical protein VNX21_05210, partial [Candidatus Thermoplasmatota archaeon]|nr:hypothetical protein [Candidatus Thermoplasmatota archaeon]